MFRLVKFAQPSEKGTVIFPPNKAWGSPVPFLMDAVTYLPNVQNKSNSARCIRLFAMQKRQVFIGDNDRKAYKWKVVQLPQNTQNYLPLSLVPMPQRADGAIKLIDHHKLWLDLEGNSFIGSVRLLHHKQSNRNQVIMYWTGLVAFFHGFHLIKPPCAILWSR